MECPRCRRVLGHRAKEGGEVLKVRYIRRTPDGKLVIACVRCGAELEQIRGRLVLFVSGSKRSSEDGRRSASVGSSEDS